MGLPTPHGCPLTRSLGSLWGSPRPPAAPFLPTDAPQLEVPPEVVAGSEVELLCRVPDNCPPLRPLLSWTGTEELWGAVGRERREETLGSRAVVALLRFRPRREDLGRRVGCAVSFSNSSLSFQADVGLDVQCEMWGWGGTGGCWGGGRSAGSWGFPVVAVGRRFGPLCPRMGDGGGTPKFGSHSP